jgi:hypothetical protein
MTEEEAFKQLAVEALAGFGLTITVDDIPDVFAIGTVIGRIATWWNGLDKFTRDLIGDFDLTDGLWNAGWMNEWPALYTLMSGNPLGRFNQQLDDILLSVRNAHERAPDYAAQHAVGRLEDDPALQGEQGT